MTQIEERLQRYGRQLDRAIDDDPLVHVAFEHVQRRRPSRWMLIAASLAVVLLAAATVAVGRSAGNQQPAQHTTAKGHGTTTYTSHRDRFSITYPASWHRAKRPLAPSPEQQELVSIGTYPLTPGATDCTGGPSRALAQLPGDGALVSIQERATRVLFGARTLYPPANPTFETADQTDVCLTGTSFEHWAMVFDDHQRSFEVIVAFGLQASAQTRDQAWQVVNSFQVTARPNAIPNHVDAADYAFQADGATAMISHANAPYFSYSTVVRNGDQICIDVRPTGQSTGPSFCAIPANTRWSAPAIATILELDGTSYLVGAATEDVTSLTTTAGGHIPLTTHQPFPTVQFFAQPVSTTQGLALQATTSQTGTRTVGLTSTP